MTLSDTQTSILRQAAQRPDGLVVSPAHLPPGPRVSIAQALLNRGLVTRAEMSDGSASWRLNGETIWLSITDTGRAAIPGANEDLAPATGVETATADPAGERPTFPAEPPVTPSSPQHRPKLRDTAAALLACWDATTEREPLAEAVAALRAALGQTARPAGQTRAPRQGTKQEAVLALLRRPEGATIAHVVEDDRLGKAHRPRLLRRPEEEGAHRRCAGPRSPEQDRATPAQKAATASTALAEAG